MQSHAYPPPPPPPPYAHSPMVQVPAQYPAGIPPPPIVSATQWSSGLCDCCSDCSNCCITYWCPCITVGQIADIADRGSSSCCVHGSIYTAIRLLTGCQWIYSAMYRSKIRRQYSLPEEPCNDYILHCCCELCAICQVHRELKHRAFDMSFGWDGNMERRTQGVAMPAVTPMEMKR